MKEKLDIKKELSDKWEKIRKHIEQERTQVNIDKIADDTKYEILGKAILYLPDKEEVYKKVIDILYPYYVKLDKNLSKRLFEDELNMFAVRKLLSNLDINLYLLTVGRSVNGRDWLEQ